MDMNVASCLNVCVCVCAHTITTSAAINALLQVEEQVFLRVYMMELVGHGVSTSLTFLDSTKLFSGKL